MTDTAFREKQITQDKPVEFNEPKDKKTVSVINDIEVPYMDYESQKGHPYTVDYFDLGSYWNEPGGFTEEIGTIESFIQEKVRAGEWANDYKFIGKKLKDIEKLTGMKDETRPIIKITTLMAYMKFLNEADGVKKNVAKYGRS